MKQRLGWLVGLAVQMGSAVLTLLLFWQRGSLLTNLALWPLKMLAGTAVNLMLLSHLTAVVVGWRKQKAWLWGAGLGLLGLLGRYVYTVGRVTAPFTAVWGADWEQHIPTATRTQWLTRRWYLHLPRPPKTSLTSDLIFGQSATGQPLQANLWQPQPGAHRSGLALVNVHGGAWVYGQKDGDLAYLLPRLAAQGHVLLDIDYTKYPAANLIEMVREVTQAVAWLRLGAGGALNPPERVALMGTSAGGHLAALAAYAPQEPRFRPHESALRDVDTAVCGLIAYYPPTDLRMMNAYVQTYYGASRQETIVPRAENLVIWNINRHLAAEGSAQTIPPGWGDFIPALVGGTPQETPELYDLLSPLHHVGPTCPPTLLVQGLDDVYDLASSTRRLHHDLRQVGVTSFLLEYPHSEHGFDAIYPAVTPVAQAAAWHTERFVAWLAFNDKVDDDNQAKP